MTSPRTMTRRVLLGATITVAVLAIAHKPADYRPDPAPAGAIVPEPEDRGPAVRSYEECAEDDILAPVTFGDVGDRDVYVYVCVNVDDFADSTSIDRLNAIVRAHQSNG